MVKGKSDIFIFFFSRVKCDILKKMFAGQKDIKKAPTPWLLCPQN